MYWNTHDTGAHAWLSSSWLNHSTLKDQFIRRVGLVSEATCSSFLDGGTPVCFCCAKKRGLQVKCSLHCQQVLHIRLGSPFAVRQ